MSKNGKNQSAFSYTLVILTVVYAVGAGVLNIFLSRNTDIVRSGILSLLVFLLATVITVIIYAFVRSRDPSHKSSKEFGIGDTLNYDILECMHFPIALVNSANRIIYGNFAFEQAFVEKGRAEKHYIDEFFKEDIIGLAADEGTEYIQCEFEGFHYNIRSYIIKNHKDSLYLCVWQDSTELLEAEKKIADEDLVFAYVNIDNSEELSRHAQEKYRSASVKVEELLREWADSFDSVFREYERDKFFTVFYAKYLPKMVSEKFDIIDKIRRIEVGDGNLPLTVSMGISHIDAGLKDKSKSSRSALDMALQRGGDQVVLREKGEVSFFGGKVQSTQKRTRVKARVTADELAMVIRQSDNVLIMSHSFPDFDAIGASVGVAKIVDFLGKPVYIVTDKASENAKRCYSRLEDIPRYSSGEILVDVSEAQELLEANTLLITVDVNNRKQTESQELAEQAHNVVVIDHHRKTSEYNTDPIITYIDPTMSSTCEMVAEMAEHLLSENALSREEADIMLAGIMLDTKNFTKNTGARTFAAAMYLRNEGANPLRSAELFKTNLEDVIGEADFEKNVTIYRDIIAIAKNGEESVLTPESRISAAKAADKLLNVEGIGAAFVICVFDDRIHISARSNGSVNVQLVLEKLGGGGHFDAAATQLLYTDDQKAMLQLKTAIDEYLTENKN